MNALGGARSYADLEATYATYRSCVSATLGDGEIASEKAVRARTHHVFASSSPSTCLSFCMPLIFGYLNFIRVVGINMGLMLNVL
jgi:hypothetical protein